MATATKTDNKQYRLATAIHSIMVALDDPDIKCEVEQASSFPGFFLYKVDGFCWTMRDLALIERVCKPMQLNYTITHAFVGNEVYKDYSIVVHVYVPEYFTNY